MPTNQQGYPSDMPAPCVLPSLSTLDPSRLLQRPVSVLPIRAESISESDIEMDNGDESDHGRDRGFEDENDDGAGWAGHPDTIGMGRPNFHDTKSTGQLHDAAGLPVLPELHALFVLKKRAARQQNCWILYRRNYYGIQGSYALHPSPDPSPEETLWLDGDDHKPKLVVAVYMRMRGVVDSETGPIIPIVVFNAKRKPLHPGDNPPPAPDRQRMKPIREGSTKLYVPSTGDRADNINVPMNHTWPRNQFRAATQNNGSRRTEQQFYHVVVELMAEVFVDGTPQSFIVASVMSEPLVVRGRCPLSFKPKNSKLEDGHTRDPDRKGRKRPRDGGRNGKNGGSNMQSQMEGQAKGASRGSCNKTGGSSRRSTRASSHLPSLTYGTRSPSTTTAPVSPGRNSHAKSTVNRETIPRLDLKLLTLAREDSEKERAWDISGDGSADLSVNNMTLSVHENI
ncbi:MAG: hypothetical protein ASARMPREDX12_001853 [Alectoria sarmentosa]|nr:MAG: hypothetical protein ASARMPREDX12_001853 [Alectoria sarmentosa]CAD6588987.1 MAG: hypothetical protein ASARMPRED_003853 [Alectoria sarmentosa]